MLDAILVMGVAAAAGGWMLWMNPDMLRYVAARTWARAYAIDIARAAYREMVELNEPRKKRTPAEADAAR